MLILKSSDMRSVGRVLNIHHNAYCVMLGSSYI